MDLQPLKEIVNSVILDPRYTDLLTLVKAARNGAVYGAKVRFPHALVMVFLFRSGTFREKLRIILKSTRQHARNLATFAVTYKAGMLFLRQIPSPLSSTSTIGKEGPYDAFLAGLVGGYAVFGRGHQSSVNQQIVIYVFARVVLALAKLSVQKGGVVPPALKEGVTTNAWPVFGALSWGMVMWLFRWHPESIQPSMRSSMKYIYVNADHWDSFRNFLIHNK